MSESELIVEVDDVEPYARGEAASQCLIDPDGVGSRHLVVNRFTLRAGGQVRGGAHPPGHDECYYVLRGRARLTLGGDPATGAGGTVREIGPDTAVFIPGGTYHALENASAEEFVILTIWPRLPDPGVQPFYDGRLRDWGTTFRKKTHDA